ncbi:MAG: hypothetical protein EBY21_01180 [Alphaproteobacteria bacterium]|nr:hypothetical protein [Alphaproteobacteria bacterium]
MGLPFRFKSEAQSRLNCYQSVYQSLFTLWNCFRADWNGLQADPSQSPEYGDTEQGLAQQTSSSKACVDTEAQSP